MLFQNQLQFHNYEGTALNLAERQRLVRDLGDKSVMILRNHRMLVGCPTVGQAFVTMFLLEKAVPAQLQAMAYNSKLIQASPRGRRHHRSIRHKRRQRARNRRGKRWCGGPNAKIYLTRADLAHYE